MPLRRLTVPVALALAALGAPGCLQVTTGLVEADTPTTGGGVVGGPQVDCTPKTIVFAPTPAGDLATAMVTCTNTGSNAGGKNLLITIGGTGASVFSAAFNAGSYPKAGLSVGARAAIAVQYTPGTVSDDQGSLALVTNAGTVTIPLVGYGLSPSCQLSIPAADVEFGTEKVGQTKGPASFAILNTGQTDCQIEAPILTVNDPTGSFQVVSTSIQPVGSQYALSTPSGPTARLVVQVSFTPKVKGQLTANVGDFASLSGTGD